MCSVLDFHHKSGMFLYRSIINFVWGSQIIMLGWLGPGGGGGHSLMIWVGVCSCGSGSPTLNKGKLLVKNRPLFRDTNHCIVLFPYTLY